MEKEKEKERRRELLFSGKCEVGKGKEEGIPESAKYLLRNITCH